MPKKRPNKKRGKTYGRLLEKSTFQVTYTFTKNIYTGFSLNSIQFQLIGQSARRPQENVYNRKLSSSNFIYSGEIAKRNSYIEKLLLERVRFEILGKSAYRPNISEKVTYNYFVNPARRVK